jgi:hypothetical protein
MTANLIEQGFGLAARTTKRFARTGAGALNTAGDLVSRVPVPGRGSAASQEPKDLDDVTIARKAESVIFRGRPDLRSRVDVNVANGVVELRGEVDRPEQIAALVAASRAIPEVLDVEDYLHTTGTPAPTRASTPRAQQKQTSRAGVPRAAALKPKLADDLTSAVVQEGEPSPVEKARTGMGRTPAPLGATDDATREAPSGGRPSQSS